MSKTKKEETIEDVREALRIEKERSKKIKKELDKSKLASKSPNKKSKLIEAKEIKSKTKFKSLFDAVMDLIRRISPFTGGNYSRKWDKYDITITNDVQSFEKPNSVWGYIKHEVLKLEGKKGAEEHAKMCLVGTDCGEVEKLVMQHSILGVDVQIHISKDQK